MKLFNSKIIGGVLAVFFIAITCLANAQCKRFTKKNCLPNLSPYTHNGQLTSAYLTPGETADVLLSFNAGKTYRILTCSQELIGHVAFKVKNKEGVVIYKSPFGAQNPSWDFKVTNTQQLTIQIYVPEMESNNKAVTLTPNGCVAVMVGFKD